MNKLLSADFAKLKMNKFFWLCTIGMFLFGIFMMTTHYIAMNQYHENAYITNVLFIYATAIAIIIPAFVSLFTGTEYSDGTMRNKLVIGHTRNHIYTSNLICCCAAGLIFCFSYIVGTLIIGIPLCGIQDGTLQGIVILILCSFAMSIAFTAFHTIISMTCQNKALAAVVNILISVFMLVISIYILNKLAQPETYESLNHDTDTGQIMSSGIVSNPDYLEGTIRSIYQFFNDFLPTGQAVNITQNGGLIQEPYLLTIYSGIIILASIVIGMLIFRKRDIK